MSHPTLTGRLRGALKLVLFAALLAVCAPAASAQEITGSIRGTVKDSTGAVVQGATVTATSPSLVRPIEVTTDESGGYYFGRLPSGLYSISVSQSGFATIKQDNINVQLGRELSLELTLTAGGVSEVVDVTATGSEAIDVTSSKTVTNISEDFIENTPKGRNVHSILRVAPGVRFEPKAGNEGVGGISIDGASGAENAYIIDGVEVTDVRKGQLRRADSIPFEFVREVHRSPGWRVWEVRDPEPPASGGAPSSSGPERALPGSAARSGRVLAGSTTTSWALSPPRRTGRAYASSGSSPRSRPCWRSTTSTS
jgi:outer membrane receptor protein involved in Fe transport